MKIRKLISCAGLFVFCVAFVPNFYAAAIIVDHTCTDLSLVPDTAISSATHIKSMMRHCSILQQLGDGVWVGGGNGLQILKSSNTKYDFTNMMFSQRGHPGGEKIIDDFYDDDLDTANPGSYVDHNLQHDVYGTYVYVTEHWWGLDAFAATMDWQYNWAYYRDQSLKIEAKYPSKKFIWCTTSLNANYMPQQVYDCHYVGIAYFNDSMRAFCRENNKILYDLADIMCHDPQGNLITKGQQNGKSYECLFTSSPVEFEQFGYSTLADRIHPNTELGKAQLAQAYWWLFARIAGWAGPATSIPAAASLLQVTSTGYADIGLMWRDNSTNEESFNVYRSTNNVAFTNVKTVGAVSGSGSNVSYTDTGLESGKKYWYYVKAANYLGESAATNTQTATTQVSTAAPNAPSALAISQRNIYSIGLTWTDNSSNEEWFRLYRSTDGTHFAQVLTLAQNAQTCTDEDLLPDTTYWYYVKAGNAAGESAASNTRSGFTLSAARELVGHYRFDDPDEIAHTTAFDSSGKGHNGAILGNPVLSSDSAKGNNSLLLDGINDYVNVVGSILLSPRQRITLCAWIKNTAVSTGSFISREGSYFLQGAGSDSKPTAVINIQGTAYTLKGAQLQLNQWHHVALTYDYTSRALKFYTDGAQASSATAAGAIDDTNVDLYIGKLGYSYFKGKVDDVRIYSHALSSAQVRALYNEVDTSSPSAPGAVRDGAVAGTDAVFTYSTTTLSTNWTASTDNESGITNYQFSIGTSPGATNITNWTALGNVLTATKTGLSLSVGTTYYFSVKAINGAGLTGTATNSNGQYVKLINTGDTTPPSNISAVRDGTGASDVAYTYITTELSANWDNSADSESGISRYYFAIGSLPGATDITNWKDNGPLTDVTETGLTLAVGATYYFSVKAENGVGLQSSPTNSDGQLVLSQDNEGPSILNVSAQGITHEGAAITWETDEHSTSRVEYGLTAIYGSLTGEYIGMNTAHSVTLTGLLPGTQYHFRAISRDGGGNEGMSADFTFTTLSLPNEVDWVKAYPNPCNFKNGQVIKFKVSATADSEFGEVKIYTMSGKLVRKIIAQSGATEITWDGKNEDGEEVVRGIYLYKLIGGNSIKYSKIAVK